MGPTFVRSRVTSAAVSALVFTLPHLLNPEVRQAGMLVAASYYTIGFLLAVITLRDGRLDLALGVHAANNLGLALIANYEGSALTGESIFTARELDPVDDISPLVRPSHLQDAAEAPGQLDEIVGLEDHVVELDER